MAKCVTFGEIMLWLAPAGLRAPAAVPAAPGATSGGGEANVAVSLAHFGLDSHYVTRPAGARHR